MTTSLSPIDTTSRRSGFWTDDRVEQLRHLCQAPGLTSSNIAYALETTRNTIIGKARRMGIDLPRKKTSRPPPYRPRAINLPRVPLIGTEAAMAIPSIPAKPRRPRSSPRPTAPLPSQSRPVPPEEPLAMVQAIQPIEAIEALFESPRGVGPAVSALRDGRCRWPVGDVSSDDFHFCMQPSDIAVPYCARHSKIACPVGAPARKGVGWGARAA